MHRLSISLEIAAFTKWVVFGSDYLEAVVGIKTCIDALLSFFFSFCCFHFLVTNCMQRRPM